MKKLLILIFALHASAACAGGYLDGNTLYERYQAKKRMVEDKALSADTIDAGFYIGYVQGAAESMTDLLCLPEKLPASRAEEVVGAYLESHPEKRQKPAAFLVRKALEEAYPCAKK